MVKVEVDRNLAKKLIKNAINMVLII